MLTSGMAAQATLWCHSSILPTPTSTDPVTGCGLNHGSAFTLPPGTTCLQVKVSESLQNRENVKKKKRKKDPKINGFKVHACACKVTSVVSNSLWPYGLSLPVSSVRGTLQAGVLEWVARPSSRGSSQSRDQTRVSYISYTGRRVLYHQRHLGWTLTKLKVKTENCLSRWHCWVSRNRSVMF